MNIGRALRFLVISTAFVALHPVAALTYISGYGFGVTSFEGSIQTFGAPRIALDRPTTLVVNVRWSIVPTSVSGGLGTVYSEETDLSTGQTYEIADGFVLGYSLFGNQLFGSFYVDAEQFAGPGYSRRLTGLQFDGFAFTMDYPGYQPFNYRFGAYVAVPEVKTWLMLIFGFLTVGVAARSGRASLLQYDRRIRE